MHSVTATDCAAADGQGRLHAPEGLSAWIMQLGRFAVGPSSGATSQRTAHGGHFQLGATGSKRLLRLPNPLAGERSHISHPRMGV